MNRQVPIILAVLLGSTGAFAQSAPQTPNPVPIFRVTVVGRTIKAINYRHRSATTLVDFRGTDLMPQALGQANVQAKVGAIRVEAHFKHLPPASSFGPEYMTYVLWAISPEGRPVNLGEVLPDHDGNAVLNVTSDLQAFGMIVTAEPYFAVTQPSDVVVMENFVTDRTNGTVEEVDAHFELLRRGEYALNVTPGQVTPIAVTDQKTPIEVYEARNAIRIAQWAGAQTYASDTLSKAELDLQNAEGLKWHDKKEAITDAREAAQTAEDAREITIRKLIAQEQEQTREKAVAAQLAAQQAQAQSQADAAAAERARGQAAAAQQAQAAAEQEQAQADAAKQAAEAQKAAAEAQAQQAQMIANQAEQEKQALRAKLEQELNSVLQTRESARGLIMNMSDVLFEFGKYTLKPEARVKLAKLSGILLAYPGLKIEIDGYTDDVGSDEYNQTLSQERAQAVQDFLVSQGVSADALSSKGFGKTGPIASNDTSRGRQENRRVELVVSGDSIKAQINGTTSASQ